MDNREKILSCALELFYERGYDAVGVQEIVDRAGITKPTLYYYFGSKQGLLEKMMKEHYEKLEESLREAVRQGGKIPDKLYRVARAFFDGATGNPQFFLLLLSLFYSGRKSEGFRTVYPLIERYYRFYVRIFEEASGELGNMNGRQEQFAVVFLGALNNRLMMAARDRDDLSGLIITDAETDSLVRQFMYGIYS